MQSISAVFGVALLCFLRSAVVSGSKCSDVFTGGQCFSQRDGCPNGYMIQDRYSNYIGCAMGKVCCSPLKISLPPTKPAPPKCGATSGLYFDRVMNGMTTSPCDWPFVVSVRGLLAEGSTLDLPSTAHACQGVLVSDQWVLTSAFCAVGASNNLDPTRLLVVAGEYNVTRVDIDPLTGRPQEQLITVDKIFTHPDYAFHSQTDFFPFDNSVSLNSNNVALFKLSEPINGRCSGVICMPTQSEANNLCKGYDDCVITGWGFNSATFEGIPMDLLSARVRLSSRDACSFITERLGLTDARPQGTICQSPTDRNADSCLGDEGGAVMCYNGNSWVVRGILPFNLCAEGKYNLYVTDVHQYLDWIQNTMALN